MQRLEQILADADQRMEPRNAEAQRRVAKMVAQIFADNGQRFEEIWDDVATEYITPLITYLKAKSEAQS